MRNRFVLWLALAICCLFAGGCGGTLGTTSTNQSSPVNGLYRISFTRGTSALTVYVNYPEVEIVVTDEGAAFPSYVGSSTTSATTTDGVVSFTSLALTGSDGESAQASGSFAASSTGTGNTLTLSLTGGLGFNGQIAQTTVNTNSLYVGTYSGTYNSSYMSGTAVTNEPSGSVTALTLAPDATTGGYEMNATGTTADPLGTPVSFAITNALVDPCGIVSNLTVVYTYSNGTAPVTNTFTTAYLNLGVVASTTIVGYQQATTSNWSNGAIETDTMLLTQTSTIAAKIKSAPRPAASGK